MCEGPSQRCDLDVVGSCRAVRGYFDGGKRGRKAAAAWILQVSDTPEDEDTWCIVVEGSMVLPEGSTSTCSEAHAALGLSQSLVELMSEVGKIK